MQVNYCETSESEGSQKGTKKDKPHLHRRRLTSSNSEGEFVSVVMVTIKDGNSQLEFVFEGN